MSRVHSNISRQPSTRLRLLVGFITHYFEILFICINLHRMISIDEVFGPVDLEELNHGKIKRQITNMLERESVWPSG